MQNEQCNMKEGVWLSYVVGVRDFEGEQQHSSLARMGALDCHRKMAGPVHDIWCLVDSTLIREDFPERVNGFYLLIFAGRGALMVQLIACTFG